MEFCEPKSDKIFPKVRIKKPKHANSRKIQGISMHQEKKIKKRFPKKYSNPSPTTSTFFPCAFSDGQHPTHRLPPQNSSRHVLGRLSPVGCAGPVFRIGTWWVAELVVRCVWCILHFVWCVVRIYIYILIVSF